MTHSIIFYAGGAKTPQANIRRYSQTLVAPTELVATSIDKYLVGALVKLRPKYAHLGLRGTTKSNTSRQLTHNLLVFNFEIHLKKQLYIVSAVAISAKTGLLMIQLSDLLTLEDLGWHPRTSFIKTKGKEK